MKKYTYGKQSIDFDDILSVVKTLNSDFLTQGPKVVEFEKAICDYTGAKYAIAVANGTAALHLAMLALGVKEGDEVITSPITFLASSNGILYAGGTPEFADVEPQTANIDPAEIEKHITPNTKGLIPVHFAGQSCDMKKIKAIADKHNLFVVEDAAHALGSDYKDTKVGSCKYSDMTIFSFHPVKTVTTGEGGAITTNSPELYEKLLELRCHGMTKNPAKLTKNDGPWYYEMQSLGYNYRLTDIQAALGLSQLKKLEKFKEKRRIIVEEYKKLLKNVEGVSHLEEKDFSNACFHLFPVLLENRGEIFEKLRAQNMFLQVHYIPVHTQPYYKNLGFKEGDFANAEEYYRKTISLPLYPSLTPNDAKEIIKRLKSVL